MEKGTILRRVACVALLAGVATLLAPARARAMTLAAMDLEDLTHTSSLVVRARCIDRQAVRNESGQVETVVRFQVLESAKGQASGYVTVRQLGGRLDGLDVVVPGAPQSQEGDEAVMFLEPGTDERMQVVGLARGYFPVVAMPGGSAVVRVASALDRKFPAGGMRPVGEFLHRVREIDGKGQ
ncbi:MAG TPA: hypothetical protein VEI94_07170 [Candidatus Bathyarchaeia archaeon]|nr:hypothetical protein [Candidatus Bathyarchaeia archaeon]